MSDTAHITRYGNHDRGKSGYTLIEILFVVAILAVLIAISIPSLMSVLNKARVTTDEANMRAGYATVMVKVLEEPTIEADATYYLLADGNVTSVHEHVNTDGGKADLYVTMGKNDDSFVCVSGLQVNADGAHESPGTWTTGKNVAYTVNHESLVIGIDTVPQP